MFANCILFATFCFMGTLVRRKKTWNYSARKVMEFGQLMIDILVYESCKFQMYIFKIAQVISENVRIAFLYVLSIQYFKRVTHLAIIAILPCGSMLQAYYVKRSFSHDAAHILQAKLAKLFESYFRISRRSL